MRRQLAADDDVKPDVKPRVSTTVGKRLRTSGMGNNRRVPAGEVEVFNLTYMSD